MFSRIKATALFAWLLIATALALASPADAAIAFVSEAKTATITGTVISSQTMNVAAGNLVVCSVVNNYAANPGFVIADTAGNTFHLVTGGPYTPDATWKIYIYYIYNATANASDTFTLSTTGGSFSAQLVVHCFQFSGVPTSPDPSTGTLANATGGPPDNAIAMGSLTLPGSQGISFACIIVDPTLTAGSGYTASFMDNTGSYNYFYSEYQIVSSSIAATASSTGTMYAWDASSAMFSVGSSPPAAGKFIQQPAP